MRKILYLLLPVMIISGSCRQTDIQDSWKQRFDQSLPLLGHRNWILVVDKAFPEQQSAEMEYINTNEQLLPVLKHVLKEIGASSHVKPVIYRDRELGYIKEEQSKGVEAFVKQSSTLFGKEQVQTLLHDSVFSKLAATSDMFKVLVLKTNEEIPYSSVFLQLDCAYWDADKEAALRRAMNHQ